MKRKTVTILFGLMVFSLWYFLWPHILMARESETIFVWDWTFVSDRLAMPWGWCSLIAAFIGQFFYYVALGAVMMALVCIAIQWLTYRLLRLAGSSAGSSTRSSIWLFVLSFIPAIAVCALPLYHDGNSEESMAYDYLQHQGQWTEIVAHSKQEPPPTKACQNAVRLALFMTKQIDESTLFSTLETGRMVLTSRTAAFIMSDIYMQMGMVSMSQRAAFEAMESIEDFNKSGRSLQRLATTSLVCGQYQVSRKYLLLLEKTLFYRSWARQMLTLAEHPQLISSQPWLSRLQQMQKDTKDRIFH